MKTKFHATVICVIGILVLLQPGCRAARTVESIKKALEKDRNHLKEVHQACVNYRDIFSSFPFGTPSGKHHPDLSWRVSLLPFLEQNSLHNAFDLKEGWNSPNNSKLISNGTKIFELSNGTLICAILLEKPVNSSSDVRDGTGNTVMLIENPNANADDWTQPNDLSLDAAVKLVRSLKSGKSVDAIMFDGTPVEIRSVDATVTDEQIRALFDPRDGLVVPDELIRRS